MKPLINLDELEFIANDHGPFGHKYGVIGQKIGAQKLGYNLTIVPPGKKVCPFHCHHINEEMFFILEGTGTLRYGDKEYPVRKHDVIACPPGKRETSHQLVNTGSIELKYLALSTKERADICEYPDSNKIAVTVGEYGKSDLRMVVKADQGVDYYEGETQ
jgi:uncharacterized cupin superfamily protein